MHKRIIWRNSSEPHICLVKVFPALRDWPFNLKAGWWFFVSFRKKFSDNTKVRIFIFFVALCTIFFQNLTLDHMTKTLNQIFILFFSTKIRFFFSATLGIRIFFLEKKHHTPPLLQVKWSFPNTFALKYKIMQYKIRYYSLYTYWGQSFSHCCRLSNTCCAFRLSLAVFLSSSNLTSMYST